MPTEGGDHTAAISTARKADGRLRFGLWLTVAALGVLVLGIVIIIANQSSPPQPVVIIHGPDYDKPASHTSVKPPASGSAANAAPEPTLPPQHTEVTSMYAIAAVLVVIAVVGLTVKIHRENKRERIWIGDPEKELMLHNTSAREKSWGGTSADWKGKVEKQPRQEDEN